MLTGTSLRTRAQAVQLVRGRVHPGYRDHVGGQGRRAQPGLPFAHVQPRALHHRQQPPEGAAHRHPRDTQMLHWVVCDVVGAAGFMCLLHPSLARIQSQQLCPIAPLAAAAAESHDGAPGGGVRDRAAGRRKRAGGEVPGRAAQRRVHAWQHVCCVGAAPQPLRGSQHPCTSSPHTNGVPAQVYPTTIRSKVLRHLYLEPLSGCYLFKGCKQQFLDAFLTAARVEMFMPGVQVGLMAVTDLVGHWPSLSCHAQYLTAHPPDLSHCP